MDRLRLGQGLGPRAALLVGALVLLAGVQLPALLAAGTAGMRSTTETLAPGLEHVELRAGRGDLAVHVARLNPGAPVRLKAVLAGGTAASPSPGRGTTSDLCRRAGGTVCVNGDFATCTSCREALGGLASGGVIRRSFHPGHEQFTLTADGFTLDRLQWRAELRATYRWPEERHPPSGDLLAPPPARRDAREEVRVLPIDDLNRGDGSTQLLTADWGAPTAPASDRLELVVTLDADVPAGRHVVDLREVRSGGDRLEPGQAVVRGPSAPLQAFWDDWHGTDAPEKHVELEIISTERVLESIGGHPVLLRDGRRAELDTQDAKVTARHPRSLVGWTADNELLLVTIDGRRPGWSRGATLAEATDLLVHLGATDAVNLDGGGSTTFVAPCGDSVCARNRPSGGAERTVPVVLALVVDEGAAVVQRAQAKPPATTDPPPAAPAAEPPAPAPPEDQTPPAQPPAPGGEADPVLTEPAPADQPSPQPQDLATSGTGSLTPVPNDGPSSMRRAPGAGPAPEPPRDLSAGSMALNALALSCLLGVAGATGRQAVTR